MSSHKIIEIGGNGPGIRRVLAPNPSPMTQTGTNTYVLGRGRVAVIDPGPDDPAHLAAILAAIQADEVITHILVTHSHLDHSPLARRLAAFSGAPVLAFGQRRRAAAPPWWRWSASAASAVAKAWTRRSYPTSGCATAR